MNSWIHDEVEKHRLDEKPKESESTGRVHRFMVKVSLDGTLMQTAVFAENIGRARSIAKKLFGANSVRSQPVKK